MKKNVIKFLVCPVCHNNLISVIHKTLKDRVVEGELECQICNKKFPIKDGIVCFVSSCRKPTVKAAQKLRKITLYQEIPKKWMRLFSKQELEALKKEWNWMISSIKKSKKSIHLDLAVGSGRFLRNIASRTKGEIVVLDFGYDTCLELQYFLKKIKKYKKISIVCADARKIPFRNETFDSISSWHGLDEPKMEEAVKEAWRVLKRGGWFTASGLHYQKDSKSFLLAKKHQINFITKKAAIQFLKKAGFKNIEHKVFFEGKWNEKESYLPIFGDFYSTFAIRGQK